MTGMSQTNYWNPSVKYIGMTSAQNFLNFLKFKKVSENKFLMTGTDCSYPCSSGECTSCACTCTSSCS